MIDLGFIGPRFTWSRGNISSSFTTARLDRVVSNTDWRAKFDQATIQRLPKLNSNHTPLIIKLSGDKKRNHTVFISHKRSSIWEQSTSPLYNQQETSRRKTKKNNLLMLTSTYTISRGTSISCKMRIYSTSPSRWSKLMNIIQAQLGKHGMKKTTTEGLGKNVGKLESRRHMLRNEETIFELFRDKMAINLQVLSALVKNWSISNM